MDFLPWHNLDEYPFKKPRCQFQISRAFQARHLFFIPWYFEIEQQQDLFELEVLFRKMNGGPGKTSSRSFRNFSNLRGNRGQIKKLGSLIGTGLGLLQYFEPLLLLLPKKRGVSWGKVLENTARRPQKAEKAPMMDIPKSYGDGKLTSNKVSRTCRKAFESWMVLSLAALVARVRFPPSSKQMVFSIEVF